MSGAEDPDTSPPRPGEPDLGPVPVVAAVIRREGRYLLGRRPAHKRHGDLWEFPGGKLDPGEDVETAARRELAEELEVRCREVGRRVWRSPETPAGFVIDFVEVTLADGAEPVAREHTEVGWFTLEELRAMPLAPSDAAFVARMPGEDEE